MNLTTSINNLQFHPSSNILAISSKIKTDSLKLLHVPTQKVFSNWPKSNTPLGRVTSLDFSPGNTGSEYINGGGYMAIGNDRGKCLLYKLKGFESY